MNEKSAHRILLAGTALWCFAIALPPVCAVIGYGELSALIKNFFAPVCHQMDGHTLHLFGVPFAVCARCTAIYFSFLSGVVFYPHFQQRAISRSALFTFPGVALFLLPVLLDVLLNLAWLNIPYPNERRVITGLLFGFPLAIALTPLFTDAVTGLLLSRRKQINV